MLAWLGGLLLIPLVRSVALKLGLVDRPNSRKIHTRPVPRLGGIAIFLAAFSGSLPFLQFDHKTAGLMAAAVFIFLIGLLDDILDLPARVKLSGQIISCLILFAFNVKIEFVTDFIAGEGLVALGLFTYPLTMLWIVGITNTVNLVDGVDGLAGGIVFIAMATLLAVRILHPHTHDETAIANVMVLSAALMGALIAFLKFNVFPASIFMGDSGAYFLGFMMSALAVIGATKGSVLFPLLVPLIALGLPLIDVLMAILRRYFRNVPIFQADKEHLHHKLIHKGFTQSDTTRFLWMVSCCFGLLAILTSDLNHKGLETAVTVFLVFMVFSCAFFFMRKMGDDGK